MDKVIFITGIRGFIPSHLANSLYGDGNSIIGIDNNTHPSGNSLDRGIEVAYGDVRYPQSWEKFIESSDLVYHMAAQINVDKSNSYPHETLDINLMGTVNVLDACRKYRKPLVFMSTSEIYGGHDEDISESSPTYAQSPYAVAKLAADKLCGNYHDLYGVEVYRARGFNVYGPWQSNDTYGAVIPIFVKAMLKGVRPKIFGDGFQRRDFTYMDDTVAALKLIPTINILIGEPVNVGTGESVSLNELVEMINHKLGTSLLPEYVSPRPGEVSKLQANSSLLKSCGWKPKVSFEEGLSKYIDWAKDNL